MKVKLLNSIKYSVGNLLVAALIDLLCRTWKLNFFMSDETKNLINSDQNVIYAFWHGTMLVPWFVLRNKKITALVSSSKDGQLLVNLLNKWKYNTVRGSSNKGGKEALEELLLLAENHNSLALTPDGPTGPANKMKIGALLCSLKTATPLLLIGIGIKKSIELKSWDKFKIPYPFTTINVVYSEPIMFDKNLSRDAVESERNLTETKLNFLQSEATKFDRFN